MKKRINPIIFRIGLNKTWKTKSSPKNLQSNLHKSYVIDSCIKTFLKKFNSILLKYDIKQTKTKTNVAINLYSYTDAINYLKKKNLKKQEYKKLQKKNQKTPPKFKKKYSKKKKKKVFKYNKNKYKYKKKGK